MRSITYNSYQDLILYFFFNLNAFYIDSRDNKNNFTKVLIIIYIRYKLSDCKLTHSLFLYLIMNFYILWFWFLSILSKIVYNLRNVLGQYRHLFSVD